MGTIIRVGIIRVLCMQGIPFTSLHKTTCCIRLGRRGTSENLPFTQKPRRNVWVLSRSCYCWRIRHAAADAAINLANGERLVVAFGIPIRQPAGSSVP